MKHFIFSLLILSLLVSSPSFAQRVDQQPGPEPTKQVTSVVMAKAPNAANVPVLQKIREQGGGVPMEFDYIAKEQDADVWLISGDKIMQMIYILPSGAAVIGGTLISPQGVELSTILQKKFADENRDRAAQILNRVRTSMQEEDKKSAAVVPDTEIAAKPQNAETEKPVAKPAVSGAMVWDSMAKLGVVHYGADKDAPVLYLVMDPLDPASQQAFKTLEPFADKKLLDLRVVPISLASTATIMQVALVLGDKDAAAKLKLMIEGTDIMPKEPPKPEGGLLLKNNADFVIAMKLNALPSIFYRRSETDPIRAVKGSPKDWAPIFTELGLK